MATKDTGKAERRAAAAEQQAAQQKKYKRNVTIVAVIFILAVVIVLLFNSNLFYTVIKAVKIGSTGYSAVDFNFFYVNEYNEIYNSISEVVGSDYASYYMPDTSESLSEQVYDSETGETWEEFITERALSRMKSLTAVVDEAESVGYTLTEDELAEVDDAVTILSYYALYSSTDLDTYLVYMYGDRMTEEIFRENYEKLVLAQSYATSISDTFEYTQDELDAAYEENADTYDYVNFYMMFVYAEMPEDDESQEALDAAMEEAEATAEEYASYMDGTDSFSMVELEYVLNHSEYYSSDSYTIGALYTNQGSSLPSTFSEWLLDSSREEGDVEIFSYGGDDPTSTDNGYYIVMFDSRDNNDYNSVNGYYLYIENETVVEDDYDTDDEYNEALESAAAYSLSLAEAISEDYDSGNYETIDDLLDAYYYEVTESEELTQIGKHDVSTTLSSWFFDDERVDGECEAVQTTDGAYVLIYISEDENLKDMYADTILRDADYDAWEDALTASYDVTTGWTMFFTRKMSGLGG